VEYKANQHIFELLYLPMNEHPIPRNITGFQFQLIGFMTLKQFGYLALGFIIAFIIFRLPISIFRYPLAALVAFIGVAFAFFPIQDRPMEIWVVNLLKSAFSPTRYVWKKEAVIPQVLLQKTAAQKQTIMAQNQKIHEDARMKLSAYLSSLEDQSVSALDTQEDQSLARITHLMTEQPATAYQTQRVQHHIVSSPAVAKHIVPKTQPAGTLPQHSTRGVSLPLGVVAGLVRTKTDPLANMLIHILNNRGVQVRLLKTNTEGKFTISLPLETGSYHLRVDDPKRHYQFRPFSFQIGQTPIQPWLIVPSETLH